MAQRPGEPTPDELEQQRRADGEVEEPAAADDVDEPLTPDAWEQRQRHDGTVERRGPLDEVPDGPLSADMIEQRQVVEYDEEDDRPVE